MNALARLGRQSVRFFQYLFQSRGLYLVRFRQDADGVEYL